jgi:hypothetical protein
MLHCGSRIRHLCLGCERDCRPGWQADSDKGHCLRVRNGTAGRSTAPIQREVLLGRDAFHSLRLGDRIHVPVGCRLPGNNRAPQDDSLEHAQFHYHPNGWLRLCAEEGRSRLEEIATQSSHRRWVLFRLFQSAVSRLRDRSSPPKP